MRSVRVPSQRASQMSPLERSFAVSTPESVYTIQSPLGDSRASPTSLKRCMSATVSERRLCCAAALAVATKQASAATAAREGRSEIMGGDE